MSANKIELIYMGVRIANTTGKLGDAFCKADDKNKKELLFERGKHRSVGTKFAGLQDGEKLQVTYNIIGEHDNEAEVDKWCKLHWAAHDQRDQILSRKRLQTAEALVDDHVVRGLKKAVEGLTMREAASFITFLVQECVYSDSFPKLTIKAIDTNKKKASRKKSK
jgi:hypothetical protein